MSTKEFASAKFLWLERVTRDHGLLPVDVRVATALASYFNEGDQGGRAFPAYKTLGDDIGASERTVIRAVRRLQTHGHLRVKLGKPGRGHPNEYWMADTSPKKGDTGDTLSSEKRVTRRSPIRPKRVTPVTQKGDTGAGEPLLNPVEEEEGRRFTASLLPERDGALEAPISSLGGGGCAGARHTAEELEAKQAKPDPHALDGEVLPPDKTHTFEALIALWPRDEVSDRTAAAQRRLLAAWQRAIALAEGAAIFAGARLWIAARAPGYLPNLANWLDQCRWRASPPKKPRPPREEARTRTSNAGNADANAAMFRKAGRL